MTVAQILTIGGRGLLALLFVLAGITKIVGPRPILDHMRQEHVPTLLLPLVIALELGAGSALLLGWHVMIAAGALAVFCLATAIVFHRDFSQRAERTQFIKDIDWRARLHSSQHRPWRSKTAVRRNETDQRVSAGLSVRNIRLRCGYYLCGCAVSDGCGVVVLPAGGFVVPFGLFGAPGSAFGAVAGPGVVSFDVPA
jgi:putative oxidoreductase